MLSKSTKTFKYLISKYYKKKKEIKTSRTLILNNLQKNLHKLETEENDKEFIVKEVRKDIEIKRRILFSFGTKAIKHYDDFKNIRLKTKLDKNKFFNPLSDYCLKGPNTERKKYFSKRFNSQKIIEFPRISEEKKIKNTINKYKSYSILKKVRNSLDFKKNDISEEENKTYYGPAGKNYILTNSYGKNNKKDNINHNFYRTQNNISVINKKDSSKNMLSDIQVTPMKTERNFKHYSNNHNRNNHNSNNGNNKFKKRKNLQFYLNYVNSLQKMRNEFTSEGKRKKKYFDNNKYGYDIFKLKYNFLRNKYFD